MATILMNVSKKKFNKCFTVHDEFDFHIVNESARKTLCNLFDALGNISSYNDYNAFMEKYNGFSKFNKSNVSRNLKTPIELSQGILVIVDSTTHELMLPTRKQLDWFLEKYQYSTYVMVSDIKVVDELDKKEQNKELLIPEEKPQEVEEVAEVAKVEEVEEVAEVAKVEEPVKKSSGFWGYFGWS
jgi:hypothetical protein